ncbi:MAG TPA: hypothetical protein VEA69_24715 [Tepidisphaeraceae bacterium]|nr:hypothetical protein [Tepidisphaeraceae bacterium]
MSEARHCPQCGYVPSARAAYCARCGSRHIAAPARGRRLKYKWAAGVLILVVVCGMMFGRSHTHVRVISGDGQTDVKVGTWGVLSAENRVEVDDAPQRPPPRPADPARR